MVRLIGIVAVALTMLGGASCARARTADVLVIVGQSNAMGYGLTQADLPQDLATVDPEVRIWDGSRFQVMIPGQNTGSQSQQRAWGPEVAFARRWRAVHPDRPLYVVKFARGSTALAPGPERDWSPASGELFEAASTELAEARAALEAAGETPRVAAILWMQGETDATDPAKADAYGANLRVLVAAIRRRWSPDAPVVIGKIAGSMAHTDAVRAGQAAAASESDRIIVIDTQDFPRQPDGLHIAAAGQRRLGEAAGSAVIGISD